MYGFKHAKRPKEVLHTLWIRTVRTSHSFTAAVRVLEVVSRRETTPCHGHQIWIFQCQCLRERESRSTNSAAARYCYCYALSITPCKRKRTYSRWRSCFTLFRFWYLQWFFKPRRNFWNKRVSVCVWGGVDNSDPVISKMGALISLFFLM